MIHCTTVKPRAFIKPRALFEPRAFIKRRAFIKQAARSMLARLSIPLIVRLFAVVLVCATPLGLQAQTLKINCGGGAVNPFVADTDYTGGSAVSYTNSVNTAGVANAAPAAVYQTARDSASSFSYSFTGLTVNGAYTVRLHFAENVYTAANQRLFDIALNGQDVADNFDIYQSAGAKTALVSSYSAIADNTGKIGLTLTAVKNDANLCGVEVVSATNIYFPNDQPAPLWALNAIPTDSSSAGDFGPSSGDEVDLASGVYENHPGPDVVVRNPIGPCPMFTRTYRSANALHGHSSSGLTPGWTHNYDLTMQYFAGLGNRGAIGLSYPNGAVDLLVPVIFNNVATGVLTPPAGAPYTAHGILGPHGGWQLIILTFPDESTCAFTAQPGIGVITCLLTTLTDSAGNSITLAYSGSLLNTISNSQGKVLLSFGYLDGVHLSGLTEYSDPNNPRYVTYGYNTQSGLYCLQSVSQLYSIPADNFPIWQYSYAAIAGEPFLTSVTVKDPSGNVNNPSGLVSNTINYNSANGLTTSLVDADRNQRSYNYQATTQVQVLDPTGKNLALTWLQGADGLDRATDATDGKGNSAYLNYQDPLNLFQPTEAINRNNQVSTARYDAFGNVTSSSVPCNGATLTTTCLYNYSALTTGQLTSVQEGSRTPTTFTYYSNNTLVNGVLQPNGLVHTMSSPLPGASGSGATVTTTYVYTALGNLATVTMPAPMASGAVTITYTYTSTTHPTEALGEPVSVSVPISAGVNAVTQYGYDARGNVTSVIDPNGFETDYTPNTQDQVTAITYPPAVTGAGRYQTAFNYLYHGGPVTSVDLLDTTGAVYRSVSRNAGNEDETTAQTGNTDQASVTFDPEFRPSTVADGDGSAHAITPKYDAADNLTQLLFPNYGANNFDSLTGVPDADGNLTQRIDGLNLTTSYNLAPDDSRLESTTYPTGTLPKVSYTYDSFGRLTNRVDGSGAFTYDYDDLDNLMSMSVVYNDVNTPGRTLPEQTISYTYYPDGHRETMVTPAGTTTYTYDLSGRLTDVLFPWNGLTTIHYDYDPGGRLIDVKHTKGATYYTYDNLGRMTTLTNKANDAHKTVMSAFGSVASPMTYDPSGDRLTMPFAIQPLSGDPNGDNPSGNLIYAYEPSGTGSEDRLITENGTRVADSGVWGGNYLWNFASDGADNLLNLRDAQGIIYDNDNHLPAGLSPVYDGNGNYIGGGYYTYDIENRLIGVNALFKYPSLTATYTDDGLRASKTYTGLYGDGGYTSYFLYDGAQVVCEINSVGAVTAAYGYGASGLIQRDADDPTTGALTVFTYNFDPMGSVVSRFRQADASTSPIDIAAYDAFGALRGDLYIPPYASGAYQDEPPIDPVGYQGEWGAYTDETLSNPYSGFYLPGNVLMTYRYYDTINARFLTRDPLGIEGGMNLYAFTRNNPVNNADPTGLEGQGVLQLFEEEAKHLFQVAEKVATNPVVEQDVSAVGNIAGGLASGSPIGTAVRVTIGGMILGNQAGHWLGNTFFGPENCPTLSAAQRLYFTYVFVNNGKVVYVGKTSGFGTAKQVMAARLSNHKSWKPKLGDTWRVIDVQQSADANAGAEQAFYDYYRMKGAKLRNKRSPLDWREMGEKRVENRRKVNAFFDEVKNGAFK